MKKVTFGLGLALVLALSLTITAFAAPITVEGTVSNIDEVAGTFTLTLADGVTTYTVTPSAGFDWTTIADGATVEVSGEDDGAGNITGASVTPATTETVVSGVIQSIDYETCTFTMLTSEGTTLTVLLPEGTDCSGLLLGTNVELTGTLNEDGTFSASGVVITPTPSEEGVNTGFYCSNPDVPHPALSQVAAENLTDYATALNWFCGGGLGVAGVEKVLTFGATYGKTTDEILAMRETMGWGRIWKTLEAEATALAIESGEIQTQGNGNGHGGGKPAWAGGGGNGHGKANGKNK